jgi:hypothetical protein
VRFQTQFLAVAVSVAALRSAFGQGSFQNLDFESAVIVPIQGGPSDHVQFAPAFPGWVGYLGTNQQTQALHNNYNLGSATIGILGPGWTNSPAIIDGSYSVALQAGVQFTFDNIVPAAIAQTGLIPATAKSIELRILPFLATDQAGFEVFVGGQEIPLVPLSTTGNYTLYGGDISLFANQTLELRITSVAL